jgi:predicted nucleic acid-binding protein
LAGYFFDSSALAKLYHPEIGAATVERIVQEPASAIQISRLTVVELPSVFAIKVRTNFITREDSRALLRQFREDIVSGKFEVFGMRDSELYVAEGLIEQYAHDLRLRAMDSIQVAVALALKAQGSVEHFVTADRVLCNVAAMEGFSVINPEAET